VLIIVVGALRRPPLILPRRLAVADLTEPAAAAVKIDSEKGIVGPRIREGSPPLLKHHSRWTPGTTGRQISDMWPSLPPSPSPPVSERTL
jgi:hypothetical protein